MNKKAGIVSALWFMILVNYLDRVAMSFAGPAIMKSLSLSPAEFGIVLSSFGIGYGLAQIPGGLLADRWGARPLLVAGPIFWALFTGMTGLVASVTGFVVVRICFGISEGLSASSYHKTIGDNFESKQRARMLALCSSATALAPAFAGVFVGKLIGAYGWQTMFMLMTVPSLLTALASYFLIPAHAATPPLATRRGAAGPGAAHDGGHGGDGSWRGILARRSLWLLLLAHIGFSIAHWGYIGWMPSYLSMAHHIDVKSAGGLSSIPYVFAFFGLVLGGWLGSAALHRYCAQLVAGCALAAGLSLFLAYQADTVPLALAGLSGAAFFLFGVHAPLGKIMLELAPEQKRASYVGIVSTAGQLGGVAAPATIGFLVGASGAFASGFGFMVGALCVAAACILALTPFLSSSRLPPKPLAAGAAI